MHFQKLNYSRNNILYILLAEIYINLSTFQICMSTALAELPRPLMKNAQGCHLYVVGVNQENPGEMWITEIWESKEDQDSSLNVL